MLTYLPTFPICMYNKTLKDKKTLTSCEACWGMPITLTFNNLMQESYKFKNSIAILGDSFTVK